MSALELYTPVYSESSLNLLGVVVLIILAIFVQVNIHLMYADEVEMLKYSLDRRITSLHEDIDALHDDVKKRVTALEELTKTLLTAQENVDADLDNHEELLEEHSEDISLAAAAAYALAPKTNNQSLQNSLGLPQAFDPNVQYILDHHIKNYLAKTELATAREIFKHLQEDKATQEEWVKMYSTWQKITRHDVNSRLYSLLAHGELKKDDSARPVWSL